MIRKLISKYGLAAHLGLLAAFPIAAFPFLEMNVLGRSLLWLTLLAAIWIFAEPSLRAGEHSYDARHRVCLSIVRDPVFYFFAFAIVFALVRYWNAGISLGYDVEQRVWLVKDPVATVLPASSGDFGFMPMVASLALAVFALGVRNALGARGRLFCGLTSATVAGVGGLVAGSGVCSGDMPSLMSAAQCDLLHSPFMGTAFGFFALLAVTLGIDAEARKWRAARFPFVVSLAGCSTGLLMFAPPYVVCLFLLVIFVFAIFSLVYCGRIGTIGGCARSAVFFFLALAVPAILFMGIAPEQLQQFKLQALDIERAFPAEYGTLAQTYARISKAMWLGHPWLGVGDGAYGLQLPFLAAKADWAFLPPHPDHAVSGYWTLLAERGIIGCSVLVVGLGILIWAWVSRLVEAFRHLHQNDEAEVFVFACSPVVWVAPVVVILATAELSGSAAFRSIACVFAYVVPLALSGASFPRNPAATVSEESGSSVHN